MGLEKFFFKITGNYFIKYVSVSEAYTKIIMPETLQQLYQRTLSLYATLVDLLVVQPWAGITFPYLKFPTARVVVRLI